MEITKQASNGVVFLKLNRPEVFNSFNRKMALSLIDELNELEQDPSVRVIVLSGEGKAFCAGQDLAEAVDDNGLTLERIIDEHYNPIVKKIRAIQKPVIVGVNGVAAGAGANIALCGDVVVAAKSALFIQAFSKIGLIPDSGGTFFLPRIIGFQLSSALMMTGDKLTSEEAKSFGLVYKVFEDEEFESGLLAIANQIAKMPTQALVLTKNALNASLINDFDNQLEVEKELQVKASETNDFKEGVNAFLEKRKPEFKGN